MMKRLCLLTILLFVLSVSALAEKKVCLTFDDGPHRKYTKEILDILQEYKVRATFFIIGKNALEHPTLVEDIAKRGHEIGNHTYSHAFLDTLESDDILKELCMADDILFDITGTRPTLFRPPGGRMNELVLSAAKSLGKSVVLWSKDTRDWSCPSVDEVISLAVTNLSDNDIILFHDYNAKTSPTPEALRQIIPSLIDEGYEFATVSEILNG